MDVRADLEKLLGLSASAVLLAIAIAGAWWLLLSSDASTVLVFLMFQVATLLSTLVLYWPVAVNQAQRHPAGRVLVIACGAGLIALNVYLTLITWQPQSLSFLTPLLHNHATFLFLSFVAVLGVTFALTHFFLLRLFYRWLAPELAHWIGITAFALAAYGYISLWIDEPVTSRLVYMIVKPDVAARPFLALYTLFHGMMLYFFTVLVGYYLTALFSRKNFHISPWMHVVYFYTGVAGFMGLIAVALKGFSD